MQRDHTAIAFIAPWLEQGAVALPRVLGKGSRVILPGRTFIARHGETVFNAAGRLQGDHLHTPLTRAGFAQAEAMGAGLRDLLGPKPALTLWSSSAGRALQTLAVIAEHLELDWHAARHDDRLIEIGVGSWAGRYYRDLAAEGGSIVDAETSMINAAPDGEGHAAIAARVSSWAQGAAGDAGDRLVLMHGVSSRILRGVLTGLPAHPRFAAPVADNLPQGSVVMIEAGRESVVIRGTGGSHA